MKIPTELKHKPVIISEDYDRIDGRNRQSEAKGLSLGLAQWNERGKLDISAKIWRHTGGKWSRQSEEMPLHRVLDLAILICRARLFFLERYKKENSGYPLPQRIGLQGGALNVALAEENSQIAGDIELFEEALRRDDEILSERLNVLHGLLNELHTR
ncbi:MAG: DUF6530 family protein [Candidatus Marinimicrobia bacterium]|jgi:hypothetical protein|nr:DUF6530 family protein [Candidatus Neomarinimicrobiota bacterium]MDX9778478.1 DUF6530 family protein [bacterium]